MTRKCSIALPAVSQANVLSYELYFADQCLCSAYSRERKVHSTCFRDFIALCQLLQKQRGSEPLESDIDTARSVAAQLRLHSQVNRDSAIPFQAKSTGTKRARTEVQASLMAQLLPGWFKAASCYKLEVGGQLLHACQGTTVIVVYPASR